MAGRGVNLTTHERVKPCFFFYFDVIISHIFAENLIEIPQVVPKIWRIFKYKVEKPSIIRVKLKCLVFKFLAWQNSNIANDIIS